MNCAGRSNMPRVLVLDDEESIRDSLMEFLDDNGFFAASAGNAEDALAREDLPLMDMVIVDIRLPRMDGPSFIKAAHARDLGLKFLIHTGSMDFQLDDELRSIGLSEREILLKPVLDMSVFVQRIIEMTGCDNSCDQGEQP